jgi:Putative transposase DNA-binding domain
MTSSAAGSIESPGSKVAGKSGLNRSILDQGWAELRRQLEYTLAWNGGRLIAAPAINTSRTCPEFGCTGQGNRKTQARFCCVACGYEASADLVAAINVRRAGLARIACEVNDGVSRQQQDPPSVAAYPRCLESPSFQVGEDVNMYPASLPLRACLAANRKLCGKPELGFRIRRDF